MAERSRRRYCYELHGLADGSGERILVRVNRVRSRAIDSFQLSVPHSRYTTLIALIEAQTYARFHRKYPEYIRCTELLEEHIDAYTVRR